MNKVFTQRLLAGLTLLSIASPLAAFADDDNHRRYDNNWRNNNSRNWNNDNNRNNNNWKDRRDYNRRNWQTNRQNYKQVQRYQNKQYNNARQAQRVYNRSHWQTNWGNNWSDQREWYHHNLANLQRNQNSDRQRQLEAQMRQQYLLYNNNNYNGAYGWNQYSDPRFLDYLHTRQPGLLTSLRSVIGM